MVLSGGCCCGAVRYEAAQAFNATVCHCPTCRKTSGAPCVAWFTVALSDFQIISGTPAEYRSSLHVTRGFCAGCGTQLTYRRDDYPDDIDITLCSLDDPGTMRPADHTFVQYRLRSMVPGDGLPEFQRSRAEGAGQP